MGVSGLVWILLEILETTAYALGKVLVSPSTGNPWQWECVRSVPTALPKLELGLHRAL